MKAFDVLRSQWTLLRPRERRLMVMAGLFVGAALLWWAALAPALRTLRTAPALHQTLDAQLATMLGLQVQARELLQRPRSNPENAMRAFEKVSRQQLGAFADWQADAAQATVTLKSVPAETLAKWLAQVREEAGAKVVQARIRRDQGPQPTWSGTLVVTLQPR